MIKPLTDLSPTELRIRCAEVLGWRTKEDEGDPKYIQLINPKGFIESIIRFGTIQDFCDNGTLPRYDTNRNALMELIWAVPEDGRGHFISFIWEYSGNFGSDSAIEAFWKLLTAPPEAIMRAFLATMEEE